MTAAAKKSETNLPTWIWRVSVGVGIAAFTIIFGIMAGCLKEDRNSIIAENREQNTRISTLNNELSKNISEIRNSLSELRTKFDTLQSVNPRVETGFKHEILTEVDRKFKDINELLTKRVDNMEANFNQKFDILMQAIQQQQTVSAPAGSVRQ